MRLNARSTALVAAVVALLTCCTDAVANPYVEPQPSRVASLQDLGLGASDSTSYSGGARGVAYLDNLWDGRTGLLTRLLHSDDFSRRRAAMKGLARIGTSEALAALRAAITDTSMSLGERVELARALGAAADTQAIPLLDSLSVDAYKESSVFGDVVELAIRLIKRPDLRRPLVERGEHFLEFRFLLDDVSAIYQLRDPLTFAYGGQIATTGRSVEGRRMDFTRDEFRTVCDLLQDGTFHSPSMVTCGGFLVIELVDGRHVALTRSGNSYWLRDEWNLVTLPFCVRADSLTRHVDRVWHDQHPDDSGGESPN